MSDDDRMDRAERIRQMREGGRSDDEASDEQPDATDGVSADDDAPDKPEGAPEPETTDEDTATPDERAAEVPESADEEGSTDVTQDTNGETEAQEAATDDEGSTLHVPGADVGDVDVDVEEMARQAGLSTVDDGDEGDESEDGDGTDGPAGIAAGAGGDVETIQGASAETRVLEFGLGTEKYCLDIEYIEEIVKRETITRVPNTPDYVEGVVDLRGQITTIIDPKVPLDIEAEGTKDLIVVFDPEEFEEQGAIGWVVDDVNQVMPIADDEVNDPPLDEEHIIGVVDRDDEFVIWTTPDVALDEATG